MLSNSKTKTILIIWQLVEVEQEIRQDFPKPLITNIGLLQVLIMGILYKKPHILILSVCILLAQIYVFMAALITLTWAEQAKDSIFTRNQLMQQE